jgi:hypothetical protein
VVCGTDDLVAFCTARTTETAHDALGSGSRDDPFILCSAAQLVALSEHPESWNAHFRLGADVDLNAFDESTMAPIGNAASLFHGTFDGCGHRITGLHRASPSMDHVGLFGVVGGRGAKIRNLRLEGVDLSGYDWVGGLASVIERGASVVACSSSGRVSAHRFAGGLVGSGSTARLAASSARGTVEVSVSRAGGLIGSLVESRLEASYAIGDTRSSATAAGVREYLGGLAGSAYHSRVVATYATGTVSIDGSSGTRAGGLTGRA